MMPEAFDRATLRVLLDTQPAPHLTITLPAQRFGKEARQAAVVFGHLLDDAETQLRTAGLGSSERQQLLAPLQELRDEPGFWSRQDEGLVAYAAGGATRCFRLPYPPAAGVVLSQHFSLRPLLPLLRRRDRFFVLALSINQVRLLEATPNDVRRVELHGLPADMNGALGYSQYYSELNLHAGGPRELGRKGAIVHGHGDADEERLERDLATYFRSVAKAMHSLPSDRPWVLAAIERYQPLFRQATRDDDRLVPGGLRGNPDQLGDEELRRRAQALLDELEDDDRRAALERLERQAGTPLATDEISTIVAAAHHGRIDTLFVGPTASYWGTFEPDTGSLELHAKREPGDEEQVDAALFHTLQHGGAVFSVDSTGLPLGDKLMALLRF